MQVRFPFKSQKGIVVSPLEYFHSLFSLAGVTVSFPLGIQNFLFFLHENIFNTFSKEGLSQINVASFHVNHGAHLTY
jgi:hypothetical protein